MTALDAVDITSMARYREHGYPWADWDLLRDQAPIYRYEGRPRFGPFWAVALDNGVTLDFHGSAESIPIEH